MGSGETGGAEDHVGHCECCDDGEVYRLKAEGGSQGPAGEGGPGEVTSKGRPPKWLVVGCRLGEIIFYVERSHRKHRVLGELPASPRGSESGVNGKGKEWRVERGKGRLTQHLQPMKETGFNPRATRSCRRALSRG